MSQAQATPPTPEAARALREEIAEVRRESTGTRHAVLETKAEVTKQDDQAKLLRHALEHLTDQVAKSTHETHLAKSEVVKLSESVSDIPGLVRRLHELEADRIIGTINADRAKDRKALVELVAQERVRTDAAILASERRSADRIDAVDVRVDELSLRIGVHVGDNEQTEEQLAEARRSLGDVKTKVDEHETFFQKNKQPIAVGAGSTGLSLAVMHLAPIVWAWAKQYAVAKGWMAP